MMRLTIIVLAGLLLAACGEKEQIMTSSAAKPDAKPWTGANPAFMVPGWKAGDQTTWENQIRARAQTQNENVRING
jgi:hypothetical protein